MRAQRSGSHLMIKKEPLSKRFFFYREPVCKPGSVLNGHLSRPAVAGRLKPPPEDGRAGRMSSRGVAPDRVYSAALLPGRRVSSYLTFPPLLASAQASHPSLPAEAESSSVPLRLSFPPDPLTLGSDGRERDRGPAPFSGISLLHLSEGRPWRVLPVILALWSPDFPHAR